MRSLQLVWQARPSNHQLDLEPEPGLPEMTIFQPSTHRVNRRDFLNLSAAGLVPAGISTSLSPATKRTPIRFGLNADSHLMGCRTPGREANFKQFVDQMQQFRPDFAVDLGDFGCQISEGQTTQEMHDGQLEALKHHVQVFGQLKGLQKGSGIHDQSL